MDEEQSPLMRIPAEVRLMIYEHLLDDGGEKRLSIRNKAMHQISAGALSKYRRSPYRIIERSFHRQCFETTYHFSTKTKMHPAIMAVNRHIHRETSHMLYGLHGFDFAGDIEAVVPFLRDLTPRSRALIREITIRKDGPMYYCESDRLDWVNMCKYLRGLDKMIPKLRIVVEGGRPTGEWEGPQELGASDLRLLALIKHESMDWIAELQKIEGMEELEIVPHMRYLPKPSTTATLLFAAFSASIHAGLVEYLRTDCKLPAKAAPSV
ncbi:autophagy-related protein 3 [Colletotrichum plurivorum]|uniref:Autophagy-related protein 3 n=1 Tax=Colletotrichum plurivorum TaxID=2175906 RepID=A0A8H6KGH7_9PEZI|nr:autophagy-related protein 3 [Colletotrichum plurivorum]